jgi:hypothetical protein
MTDDQDWDALADDESQWGEPTEIEPAERVESVVSVRLAATLMEELRANARDRGQRISAYLRSLIVLGLAVTDGTDGSPRSVNQVYIFDGYLSVREHDKDVGTLVSAG